MCSVNLYALFIVNITTLEQPGQFAPLEIGYGDPLSGHFLGEQATAFANGAVAYNCFMLVCIGIGKKGIHCYGGWEH